MVITAMTREEWEISGCDVQPGGRNAQQSIPVNQCEGDTLKGLIKLYVSPPSIHPSILLATLTASWGSAGAERRGETGHTHNIHSYIHTSGDLRLSIHP